MMHRLSVALVFGALLLVPAADAQRGDSGIARDTSARRGSAGDSLYLRARRLVLEGNGDVGRALVDSMLTAAAGTPAYADALYWRAALAATAADAERDYRRVIVEFPFSPHAGDALLALAQLEMARGDREPAIDHLQRFLLQRPYDPERVRAGIWLGRLLVEQNQLAKGCAVLLRTRATLGNESIETRNQVDYHAARCAGVDTTPPPPPAPRVAAAAGAPRRPSETTRPPAPDSARRDASRREIRDTTRPAAATTTRDVPRRDSAPSASALSRYTVQVAAYESRSAAEQLIERLAARGVTARLVGNTAPFRVRVGSFVTEAEAEAAARDLKTKGITVFVTTTDIERAAAGRR